MRRYQTDPGSPRADLFVAAFLAAALEVDMSPPEPSDAAAEETRSNVAEAASLLREWDRRYTRGNERAILFELAMNELEFRAWDELVADEPDGVGGRFVAKPREAVLARLLHDPESAWWDDRRTPDAREDRDDVLRASLGAALLEAKARYGNPKDGGWRWDGIRHANIHHLIRLPRHSALGLPVRGGPSTLNPSSGNGTYGASWRMVVELGPSVRAWGIYPGGQSGNPVSSRYLDRLPRWIEGKLDSLRVPHSPRDLMARDVTSFSSLSPGSPE